MGQACSARMCIGVVSNTGLCQAQNPNLGDPGSQPGAPPGIVRHGGARPDNPSLVGWIPSLSLSLVQLNQANQKPGSGNSPAIPCACAYGSHTTFAEAIEKHTLVR